MTTTPAATGSPLRNSRRLQGLVVIGTLLASVAVTAALVAVPAPAGGAGVGPGAGALPAGTRVAIQGGNPIDTFELADRLEAVGVVLDAVEPAPVPSSVTATTTILYYDLDQLVTATRVRAMLGRGTLRRQQVFQPGVDITIVLGKDRSRL